MITFKHALAVAGIGLAMMTNTAAADPTDDFGWILIAELNDGVDPGAVDALVAQIIDAAQGNDGLHAFNFARAGTTLYGYELFDDQAAFFEHFSRVEALVPQMLDLWSPSAIVPTHDLPEQVANIMQQMGAVQPEMTAAAAQ